MNKKQKSVLGKFPSDCFSHILLFLDSSKDFMSLVLAIKGLYDYFRRFNKSSTINIPFRIYSMPTVPQPHVNILFVSNKRHGKEGFHNMVFYLAGTFECNGYEELIKKISSFFPSLIKLKIFHGNPPRENRSLNYHSCSFVSDESQLGWMKELEIVLMGCEVFTLKQQFSDLRKLILRQKKVSHQSVLHIDWSKLPKVNEVYLRGFDVKSNFTGSNIRHLSLRDTKVEKEKLFELKSILQSLRIKGTSVIGLDQIRELPDLRTLSIDLGSEILDANEIPLEFHNLPRLEKISIKGFEDWIHPSIEISDRKFPRLRSLKLVDVPFECTVTNEILKNLNLLVVEFSRVRLCNVSRETRMCFETLIIHETHINREVELLLSSPNLEYLHFNPLPLKNNDDDEEEEEELKFSIEVCNKLRLRELMFTNSDQYELTKLKNCPSLSKLEIVYFSDILELENIPKVRRMYIIGLKGGKKAVENFVKNNKWKSLRYLTIDVSNDNNNISSVSSFILDVDNFPKLYSLKINFFRGVFTFNGYSRSRLTYFVTEDAGYVILKNHPKLLIINHRGFFTNPFTVQNCPRLKEIKLKKTLPNSRRFNLELHDLPSCRYLRIKNWGMIGDLSITKCPNINKLELFPGLGMYDMLIEDGESQEEVFYTFPVTNDLFPGLEKLWYHSGDNNEDEDIINPEIRFVRYKVSEIEDIPTLKEIKISGNIHLEKNFAKRISKRLQKREVKVLYLKEGNTRWSREGLRTYLDLNH